MNILYLETRVTINFLQITHPAYFSTLLLLKKRRLYKQYDAFSKEIVERLEKISVATVMLSFVENDLGEDGPGMSADEPKLNSASRNKDLTLEDENGIFEYAPDIQEMLKSYSKYMENVATIEQGSQTILDDSYLKSLEGEYFKIKTELSEVKEKDIFRDMELDMFKDNDDKVKCLTGLKSYSMLKALSVYVKQYQGVQGKLTKFQQLMITLIKLKQNLPMPFIAILFNVSLATISRLFRLTIDILFKKVVPLLVFWPSREDLRELIPSYFEDCENCLYSIDCFEMEVELRGSSSMASKDNRDESYDLYAPSNVTNITKRKYFMTVAPQGAIMFISKGVEWEVSDKIVALESGFFEHIAQGDVILTERRMDFGDEIEFRGGSLELMSSTKYDCPSLVSFRRVIQLLKERYQILEEKMLRKWVRDCDEDFSTCDKIVQVSCALFNMTNTNWNHEECLPIHEC